LALAGIHTNFGLLLETLRETALAEQQQQIAGNIVETLAQDFPSDLAIQVLWCGNQINQSRALRDSGKPQQALGLLQQAADRLEAILHKNPSHSTALAYQQNALVAQATCLDLLQQFSNAAAVWERLVTLTSGKDQILYRSRTSQSLVRAGETARAIEIANSLSDVTDPSTIFARARVFALAFGITRDESLARRSVELLQQLVSMGLDDAARLRSDPDLSSLQGREDLTRLIAEIEAKTK
jgi:tetratricopeptide (TPR) repeat protein